MKHRHGEAEILLPLSRNTVSPTDSGPLSRLELLTPEIPLTDLAKFPTSNPSSVATYVSLVSGTISTTTTDSQRIHPTHLPHLQPPANYLLLVQPITYL